MEDDKFFYVKVMKKESSENQFKYDIVFMNEQYPSTDKDKGPLTDKGKGTEQEIAKDKEKGLSNTIKRMLFEPTIVITSNKRQHEDLSIETLGTKKNDGMSSTSKEKTRVKEENNHTSLFIACLCRDENSQL
ncbi:hypothetical protein Adt_28229 [Abeliophyllum distichum]|uniref:Uncharacterized protein n=1 Tax=Abeliophyllum distichum TaxID=126358 RepID=A0ABD1RWP1_9LAMI